MHKLGSVWTAWTWLAAVSVCAVSQAGEPVGVPTHPPVDVYSTYADAYFNPAAAGPDLTHDYGQPPLWKNARWWKIYAGGEFMQLWRTKPFNQILVRQDPGLGIPVLVDDRPLRPPLVVTDQFDYGDERDGWRATLGVEISPYDKFDVSFHRISGLPPARLLVVAEDILNSTLALEIHNETNVNPGIWFPRFDPDDNPLDAGISRFGENFAAQYIDDAMWGIDGLWRHRLDWFTWNASNWEVWTLGGFRVVHTSENFRLWWNRNTVDIDGDGDSDFNPFLPNPILFNGLIPTGPFDPRGTAVDGFQMEIDVRNFIVGPQFGIQARRRIYEIFEFDLTGKGGFVANFATVEQSAQRFDGVILPDATRSPFKKEETQSAGLLESRLALNFYPHERIKLWIAAEFLWLINVSTATEQIEPNLELQRRPSSNDDIFYSGWSSGAEIKF